MTNKKNYNFFLFLSTLTRSLVEVFSVILLYKKDYSINNILIFLLVTYLTGIIINYISLSTSPKKILIISTILYGISYIYLSKMTPNFSSLIIFAIILSSSSYSYHALRHSLALTLANYKTGKNISFFLLITYLATIISNLIGIILIEKLPFIITSILILTSSFISIIPILKLKNIHQDKPNLKEVSIPKQKIIFNILEQFKVILVEIQPLYLYIYVKSSLSYVGIFNILINLASLIVMLCISKKITQKHFKYITLLLGIILLLKINLTHPLILLIIAFLEGLGTKLFEKFSLNNLYHLNKGTINSYLIVEELIFFITKSLLMLIFIIFIKDLKLILYICILGIIASGFFLKDPSTT